MFSTHIVQLMEQLSEIAKLRWEKDIIKGVKN